MFSHKDVFKPLKNKRSDVVKHRTFQYVYEKSKPLMNCQKFIKNSLRFSSSKNNFLSIQSNH